MVKRTITRHNIHFLTFKDHQALKLDAEALSIDWSTVCQIDIDGKKVTYTIFLLDENAMRYFDSDASRVSRAATETRTFIKGVEVTE